MIVKLIQNTLVKRQSPWNVLFALTCMGFHRLDSLFGYKNGFNGIYLINLSLVKQAMAAFREKLWLSNYESPDGLLPPAFVLCCSFVARE